MFRSCKKFTKFPDKNSVIVDLQTRWTETRCCFCCCSCYMTSCWRCCWCHCKLTSSLVADIFTEWLSILPFNGLNRSTSTDDFSLFACLFCLQWSKISFCTNQYVLRNIQLLENNVPLLCLVTLTTYQRQLTRSHSPVLTMNGQYKEPGHIFDPVSLTDRNPCTNCHKIWHSLLKLAPISKPNLT